MGMSRNQAYVVWSSANTKTLNSNGQVATSDAFAFNDADVSAQLTLYASTASTPATGDYVDFYVLWTTGDGTGGGGADNFDSQEHAQFLYRLNNYASDTPGEQPAQRTVQIPVAAKGFKIQAIASANAGTRNQTIAVRVSTQRAA